MWRWLTVYYIATYTMHWIQNRSIMYQQSWFNQTWNSQHSICTILFAATICVSNNMASSSSNVYTNIWHQYQNLLTIDFGYVLINQFMHCLHQYYRIMGLRQGSITHLMILIYFLYGFRGYRKVIIGLLFWEKFFLDPMKSFRYS